MWMTHPDCEKLIKNTWDIVVPGSPSFKLVQKIKRVRNKLKKWNKEVFGNLKEKFGKGSTGSLVKLNLKPNM